MKAIKVVLIIFLVLLLAVGGVIWYVFSGMRKDVVPTVSAPSDAGTATQEEITAETLLMSQATPEMPEEEMPIYEETSLDEEIVNILLVGTDSRTRKADDPEGRSDTMILASYHVKEKRVQLISFMRDTRVWRVGTSGTKFTFENRLNGAYSGGYGGGGVGELINTLNYNFGLDIQDYVCVGFNGFVTLIDKIGGLDVELDQAEIYYINDRIQGHHPFEPDVVKNATPLKGATPGIVHLDGAQSLIYARNRSTGQEDSTGGSDFNRVNRQQEVIMLIYKKIVKEMDAASVSALLSFAREHIATNIDASTMLGLAMSLYSGDVEITSAHVPFEGTYHYWVDEKGTITSQLVIDYDETKQMLHELIYGADAADAADATATPQP